MAGQSPSTKAPVDLRALVMLLGDYAKLPSGVTLENYKCKGFLTKLGAKRKNWLDRWFVLDLQTKILSYYTDMSETKLKGEVPIKVRRVISCLRSLLMLNPWHLPSFRILLKPSTHTGLQKNLSVLFRSSQSRNPLFLCPLCCLWPMVLRSFLICAFVGVGAEPIQWWLKHQIRWKCGSLPSTASAQVLILTLISREPGCYSAAVHAVKSIDSIFVSYRELLNTWASFFSKKRKVNRRP